jgi:hypothetical protein
MDVLLKGAATTFAGGFILLVAYLAMLASTGVYGLVGRRQNRVASESAAH